MKQIFILLSLIIFLSGCGEQQVDKKDIIAYVNKEPILGSELDKELEIRSKQDPAFKFTPEAQADQLDMIIDRKLMTQDAVKKGLAREDKFVSTIKTFWEQTLIRDFIELKKEEFKKNIVITDDDINKYYANLSERVTFKAIKSRSKQYVEDAKTEFERNKESTMLPWQTIGPVGYEELSPGILMDLFDLPAGDVKMVDMEPNFFLIYMAARDKRAVEPLAILRSDIEKRVRDIKEARMFEDWMRSERKKANIKLIGR